MRAPRWRTGSCATSLQLRSRRSFLWNIGRCDERLLPHPDFHLRGEAHHRRIRRIARSFELDDLDLFDRDRAAAP
jgi:hypothetical protein